MQFHLNYNPIDHFYEPCRVLKALPTSNTGVPALTPRMHLGKRTPYIPHILAYHHEGSYWITRCLHGGGGIWVCPTTPRLRSIWRSPMNLWGGAFKVLVNVSTGVNAVAAIALAQASGAERR